MNKIEQLISEYTNINPFSGQIIIARQDEIIKRFEDGYRDFETKSNFSLSDSSFSSLKHPGRLLFKLIEDIHSELRE